MRNFLTPKFQLQLNQLHKTVASKLEEVDYLIMEIEDYLVMTVKYRAPTAEDYLNCAPLEDYPPNAAELAEDTRKYFDNEYYYFLLRILRYKGYAKTLKFYRRKAHELKRQLSFIMRNRQMLKFDPDGWEYQIQREIRIIVSEIQMLCNEVESFHPWRTLEVANENSQQYQGGGRVSGNQGGVASAS